MNTKVEGDRKVWFSMWFLGAIVTFGIAFFPMFYRLVEGRNSHFRKEAEFENRVSAYLKSKGKEPPVESKRFKAMNTKAWAASIILVMPSFRNRLFIVKRFSSSRTKPGRLPCSCSTRASFYATDNTDKNLCNNNFSYVGRRGSILALQGR